MHRSMAWTTAVGMATGPRIANPPCQPCLGDLTHVAGAASNDLDSVARQDVDGPAAHVPGQHHGDAHAGQLWDDVRLASTARWGRQHLLRYDLLVVNLQNGETLAVAEMLIDLVAIRR